MNKPEIKPWEVLESSFVFGNRWLSIRRDVCRTNRGNTTDYYVIERSSYVVVVALTPQSQVLLARQYKHGVGQIIPELPAGYIEDGEDPLVCAHRELREETGYEAETMEPLAVLFAAPSAASYSAHLFLATGVQRAGEQHLDANEKINVEMMDFSAAAQAAAENRVFRDLSSTTALLMAWHKLHGQGTS